MKITIIMIIIMIMIMIIIIMILIIIINSLRTQESHPSGSRIRSSRFGQISVPHTGGRSRGGCNQGTSWTGFVDRFGLVGNRLWPSSTIGVCEQKQSSGENNNWKDQLSESQIRGRIAVSSAGLRCKGLNKRSVCSQTPV